MQNVYAAIDFFKSPSGYLTAGIHLFSSFVFNLKSCDRILMKFSRNFDNGPRVSTLLKHLYCPTKV